MRTCEVCNLQFDTFQAKANHVRWNHSDKKYSEAGMEKLKATIAKTNYKRFGGKTYVSEQRTCQCGTIFVVTFSPERSYKGRITCSSACAARRKMSEAGKESLRKFHKSNPEVWHEKGRLSPKNVRNSSKAERALAAALQIHGYNRHHLVKTQDITFDVDIASLDKKVWIESDGSWHFRKMHEGHNFELTKLRDSLEEQEAINRQVLLIRVNNEASTIEEQVDFILREVSEWNRVSGKIVKFRY